MSSINETSNEIAAPVVEASLTETRSEGTEAKEISKESADSTANPVENSSEATSAVKF